MDSAQNIALDVTAVQEQRLVVTDAGDGINCDLAVWAIRADLAVCNWHGVLGAVVENLHVTGREPGNLGMTWRFGGAI